MASVRRPVLTVLMVEGLELESASVWSASAQTRMARRALSESFMERADATFVRGPAWAGSRAVLVLLAWLRCGLEPHGRAIVVAPTCE